MTTRPAMVLVALVVLAAGCSVERLPVPSDRPANASASASLPQPIQSPWATIVSAPPDASTSEVLGEEPGSVLVANVHWFPRDPAIGSGPGDFDGQPAMLGLAVVRPDGTRREVASLFLAVGTDAFSLGPTGYIAVSVDPSAEAPQAGIGAPADVVIVDLRDPAGPAIARLPLDWPGEFGWAPSGVLSLSPFAQPGRRLIFDPATSRQRAVDLDLTCCVSHEWTADGSAWFARRQCDPPCGDDPGLVDSQTGAFRPTNDLPLPFAARRGASDHEFDRHGSIVRGIVEFDDMGKGTSPGQVITVPAKVEEDVVFDDPRATIWWDSRLDKDWWRWHGWDTDGEGLLVARSVDGSSLELTRYDEPREPATIAVLHPGPIDPTSVSVEAVRDVSGNGVPDVVFGQVGDGPTWWFSGTTGRLIEIGTHIHTNDVLQISFVVGWIED